MRSRSRFVTLIIAILAALTFAAPVSAANQWETYKQAGTSAYAFTDSCSDIADGTVTCSGQSIDVFEGTIRASGEPSFSGEQVCYGEHSETYDLDTGEFIGASGRFGCALDAGTVTIRKLNAVTLASTVIELTRMDCDPTECTESPGGSITVSGTWTGEGPTIGQRGKFRLDDGLCIQLNADKGTSRAATFVGSIDAHDARIGKGSFTFKTSCTF